MPIECGEGKSCSTCSTVSANPLDRLATLGRQTQNIELLPITRSLDKGSPIEYVSSSTGELAFAQTDLAFKDNPLLLFQRNYVSSRTEDFGLGRGWSFAFNDSIALNNNNAVLTSSTGDDFTYRRAEAKLFVLQTADSTDVKEFNVENGNTILAKNGDITKIYKRTGNGSYYLSQITAPGGFEVTINRNGNGKIRSISSLNGEINFDWSNGNDARLLTVTDNTGRRISFGQPNNSLQSVTTATGGKWQYDYAGGKISNITDPANRIILRAKFDANGRAIEIGDAVGLNRLAYETNANNISTRTTFIDSLSYARVFQHNERGILTNIRDNNGTLLSIQYDENNQPTQVTDANGATATFEYDAQKRLTRQVVAGSEKVFEYAVNGKLKAAIENGERTEIVYDSDGNLAERRSRRNGKNVRSTFNRRGQEVRLEVENGLVLDFEYDNKGRKNVYDYSDTGRYEKTFDAAGRKKSEKLPDGFIHNYEYDANNRLVRQSNNRGGSARVERDASGNLTKITNQNTEVQILRDEAGRIVQLTNSRGQSRRYAYNSRGALTRFIGADGRDLRFQYNERGEVQSVLNVQNANFIYQRNQSINFAKIQQSASQKDFWQIQKISYANTLTNSMGEACAFGDAFESGEDGWMDSWGSGGGGIIGMSEQTDESGESGCYDPFSNMGSGGGGPENCQQCLARERKNCNDAYDSNLLLALGGSLLVGAGCTAITFGVGIAACGALVVGGNVAINEAHKTTLANCRENVASKCETKCK